jgi:hypothetical protein
MRPFMVCAQRQISLRSRVFQTDCAGNTTYLATAGRHSRVEDWTRGELALEPWMALLPRTDQRPSAPCRASPSHPIGDSAIQHNIMGNAPCKCAAQSGYDSKLSWSYCATVRIYRITEHNGHCTLLLSETFRAQLCPTAYSA